MQVEFDKVVLLLKTFQQNRSSATLSSYGTDLEHFRQHLQVDTLEEAVTNLISAPHSQANLIVLHYKVKLQKKGLKYTTINRRLSTLRSIVKTAKLLGLINWQLEIENTKIRNTAPFNPIAHDNLQKMFDACRKLQSKAKAKRDYAILRLLYDLALKRISVVNLDMSDIFLKKGVIQVMLPRITRKKEKKLPVITTKALKAWVKVRGEEQGPLFTNLDQAGKGKRLTGTSVYRIVRKLGAEIGIKIGPQTIRNAAVGHALVQAGKAGIKPEDVLLFSGHKNLNTLLIYQAKHNNIQEKLSQLISN